MSDLATRIERLEEYVERLLDLVEGLYDALIDDLLNPDTASRQRRRLQLVRKGHPKRPST